MIELNNIVKSFGENTVLKGISTSFLPGKMNFVIGQSGSGKSVLTKCTVGLYHPNKGNVTYDGRDFTRMNDKEKLDVRKEIGMLFQGSALFDSMTVEGNVKFPLDILTDMKEAEKNERVEFCLRRVQLEGKNDLFPSEISGGMQKRVGIARAIALQPKYLFVDEPNSGLDPKTSIVIDQLIKELTDEYQITTVIVSHDMNSVIEVGDNINFIHKGELWWRGDKNDILTADNQELMDFVYASDLMKRIRKSLSGG